MRRRPSRTSSAHPRHQRSRDRRDRYRVEVFWNLRRSLGQVDGSCHQCFVKCMREPSWLEFFNERTRIGDQEIDHALDLQICRNGLVNLVDLSSGRSLLSKQLELETKNALGQRCSTSPLYCSIVTEPKWRMSAEACLTK